jgi:Tol biopolymer transport system component
MGEVYRARDTKLSREVAVKILPAEFSADSDRLARFEREARSASALNHPNIVTIHDVGRTDSISFIAMELVQGQTLRSLLADGPLPMKRVLALGAQITEGLARAHEAGIVHRDLKPENLMVTKDGLVKILDFGLAKHAVPVEEKTSRLPAGIESTGPGVLMGTAGYMSPEQASGQPVGFRSDQFSFGAILYEMVTGKRAFACATEAETMAAIISGEPESIARLAPQTPAPLRWILERCLAKDPDERYASTRDLARELVQLRDHASEIAVAGTAAQVRRPTWVSMTWAAGVVLIAALAFLFGVRGRKEPVGSPLRFTVSMPSSSTTSGPAQLRVTISPDGSRLGMEAFWDGQRRLYVRPLDAEVPVELPGTLGATGHIWSPDGRHLAYWADGKLKKVAVAGGPPVDLCEARIGSAGAWSPGGTILFPNLGFGGHPRGLFRVSDTGGEPQRVTTCGPEEENHKGPWFLPDGRHFLYLMNVMPGSTNRRELRLGSLDSKERRVVTYMDSRAEYSPLGYLVFVREGALFAQRFDEKAARLAGEPFLLADDVNYLLSSADASFSISRTNVLVYRSAASPQRIVWMGRDGREIGTLGEHLSSAFRISPDGQRIAVGIAVKTAGTRDIWLLDTARGIPTRLQSTDTIHDFNPVWTPDGSGIFYGSDRQGAPDIYAMTVGESPGVEKLVLQRPVFQQPEDISRDGRLLVFGEAWPKWDIWLMPLDGSGEARAWANTRFTEANPRFSPDGRWIAYDSDESGDPEIYIARTQDGGGKRRISPAGGRQPRWRADGRELYYIGPGDLIMAVPVTPGATLGVGTPVPLFRAPAVANYEVTADGSRFLVGIPTEPGRESQVHVIVNWTAAMKQEK